MKKKIVKVFLLVSVFMLYLVQNCLSVAAAENITVTVDVKFGQTEARKMLDMINDFRTGSEAWYWNASNTEKVYQKNLSKLEYDYGLEAVAKQRAVEIAVSFSHTRPNGESCFTALGKYEVFYFSYGENIAAGYASAADAFVGWQETNYKYDGQGHRRNMLSPGFTHVGIAHVYVNGYHYWVQEFGYGSSNEAKTSADDGNKSVNVEVNSSLITNITVETAETLTISVGKSVNVPSAEVKILVQEAWPGIPVTFAVVPDWSVSGNAVSISQGKITAGNVGSSTLTATVYGKKLTVPVTVVCTEHKWGSWTVTKEATCTDAGTETRKCSVCNKTETRTVSAKGHTMSEYKVTKEATCMDAGTETRKCSVCNVTETRTIPAKGHVMGSYKVTKKPTKDKEGIEERVCSVCGKTEQRAIEKLASENPGKPGTSAPNKETTTGTTPEKDVTTEKETTLTDDETPEEGTTLIEDETSEEGTTTIEDETPEEETTVAEEVTSTEASDPTKEDDKPTVNTGNGNDTQQNSIEGNAALYVVLGVIGVSAAAGGGVYCFYRIRKNKTGNLS